MSSWVDCSDEQAGQVVSGGIVTVKARHRLIYGVSHVL